ncbi:hypothetical protein, conserved [Eimeria maxima]|uniref:O-acyltransferase WSD1 C-terminal domain-containing protein n=1 Tax=Eimeria maxima TaxID=5804 RepID=U6MA47_EIMMA|nr:hypothetical protein, conserved [Eimeria maxima]CDJ58515.1 hypothetical protein, conserved [Eimeria maxima]
MLAHMLRFLQGSKVNSTCRSPGDRESLHHAHDSSSADCQPFQHADESNSNANVAKDDGKRRGIFGFLKLHSDCPSKAALRACPPSPRTSSAAETNAYDEHEGDTRWQSAETDDRKPNDSCSPPDSSNDSSTSGAGACSELYCPACGELGGALLCHECGPRPDNTFLRHYRRSYLYKALDILLSLAEFVGRSLLCVGSMLSKYLCTGGGKSEANEDAGVGGFKARRAAPSGLQLTEGACRAVRRRPGKGTQQKCSPNSDIQGPTDEQRQSVQHDTTEAAGKETNKQRQQEECKGNKLTPPPLRDPGSVTHKFWATVNFLEDLFVSLSLRHPLSGWLSWSLLSIGFYCVLNCMLWPLLILFFVYRRIRFYAWEAAVRLRRSIVFSDDLLAQLQRQQQQQLTSSRGWGLIPLPVPRGVGSKGVAPIEILSLMESQEKLFFSMPWMAVTGFSYCERLSFQELCMAITQKLLKPKQEFACLANCTGGSDFLDQLPVSAFLHPRLLARVQRVMGRYCWVRQPGFKVSQQVIKFTKKGINVLRKQRCAAKGEPEEGSKSGEENSCFCRSAAECNCLMDEADVLCLVNEALSQPLDPMKPLWQFLYLENVIMPPNPAENPLQKERIGSAVVFRMHHAVGDGISITRMFLKDFLCSSPANPGCSINDRPFYPIDATEESFLQDKTTSGGDGVEGAASSLSRASISNQPVSATHKCEEGTPVSAASTSTMWTVSGLSLKACVDGCDATTEKCMQRSSQAVGGAPTNGGPVTVAAAAQVGAAQKPPVSICSIPNTVFWRLFVALRFALQLPFYGAGMAMLLSYDELLKAPRSGSANRTRIAPPICLSLQELKDLKTRLIVALAKQQQQQQQQQQEQQHDARGPRSTKTLPKKFCPPYGDVP